MVEADPDSCHIEKHPKRLPTLATTISPSSPRMLRCPLTSLALSQRRRLWVNQTFWAFIPSTLSPLKRDTPSSYHAPASTEEKSICYGWVAIQSRLRLQKLKVHERATVPKMHSPGWQRGLQGNQVRGGQINAEARISCAQRTLLPTRGERFSLLKPRAGSRNTVPTLQSSSIRRLIHGCM